MTDAQFTKNFDDFALEGDSIETESGPLRFVATLYRDDCSDRPDERDDGFWPSLDPESAGYIGPKSKRTLARHMARAESVMQAWKDDEWYYAGVAVRAFIGETPLTGEYDSAVWGIECNYPSQGRNHNPNHYLRELASSLVRDCADQAKERLEEIAEAAESL